MLAAVPSSDIEPQIWLPDRVLFTPSALTEPWGKQILARVESFDLPVKVLKSNRLTGLQQDSDRQTYTASKRTLAVVTAPPSSLKLSPIPPSADWQFHLAQGCPAHCQYCYLAGSLSGPPIIRVFANLPQILQNLPNYQSENETTSFEVSCYTDPLAIEHFTGSLAECIRYFGTEFSPNTGHLRWVSKFDRVEPLLDLPHGGRTRCRISVNALPISRSFEGGTASVPARLAALRRLALPPSRGGGGYPVGVVIAPIMPIADWQLHYGELLDAIANALDFDCDLTFELISHRFTPNSKSILQTWYPSSKLDMEESDRQVKRNKFGGIKYVYHADIAKELRHFFEKELAARFPQGNILYWT